MCASDPGVYSREREEAGPGDWMSAGARGRATEGEGTLPEG